MKHGVTLSMLNKFSLAQPIENEMEEMFVGYNSQEPMSNWKLNKDNNNTRAQFLMHCDI